jgi:DNA sulfur modification protein DndC
MTGPVDNLFAQGVRMLHEEAIELTLASLRAYWPRHQHFAVAFSGGKDSATTLTLLMHLIDAGELPQPECLHVFYADTRQEMPPIAICAEQILDRLRLRNWVKVHIVRAALDKRFWVYILGRGVPPPNNNTLRWCTRQIKVEPMSFALEAAIAGLEGNALMITGVRQGESAVRDGRIAMSCGKDGAECGQGWYQQVLPEAKGIRGRLATLAPILHFRVCHVFDWLVFYAPQPEFGGWPTKILVDAYGGDDAIEKNARTGCIECPLAEDDTAMQNIVAMPAWDHLAPLRRIKALHRWLREPQQRLRKPGGERLKDGKLAKNQQRMGPLTIATRLAALETLLAIQAEVNEAARRLDRPGIDLLDAEEEARIRELIAANTWPDGWAGDEPRADIWLDRHNEGGTIEPILFRDLVGQ